MHENRETSGVPRPEREGGRSAKAQSQKADAHAPEESDRTILSMNQTNKEERSSAEPGKKRVRAKENIVQPNTHPTQSGERERVSQGLDGVREAAKKRRQERFTALLHHVSADLLLDSYYALKRQAAPGVDGVTWQEYETGLKVGLPIYITGYTVERIGHSPHEGSTFRRLTGGNARWALRRWKTKSYSKPW